MDEERPDGTLSLGRRGQQCCSPRATPGALRPGQRECPQDPQESQRRGERLPLVFTALAEVATRRLRSPPVPLFPPVPQCSGGTRSYQGSRSDLKCPAEWERQPAEPETSSVSCSHRSTCGWAGQRLWQELSEKAVKPGSEPPGPIPVPLLRSGDCWTSLQGESPGPGPVALWMACLPLLRLSLLGSASGHQLRHSLCSRH